MEGELVANYRIVRKIGEGGMGAVYLAEHALLGRPAAVKMLLREMSHRDDVVTRFFNEARAATAVKHPGIVEVYDFGHHGDERGGGRGDRSPRGRPASRLARDRRHAGRDRSGGRCVAQQSCLQNCPNRSTEGVACTPCFNQIMTLCHEGTCSLNQDC
jgi:serine/threonine protein kinase